MKTTNRELSAFRQAAAQYIQSQGSVQNKLTYACQKMLKRTEKLHAEFSDKVADARAEFALVKDGSFVLDDKSNFTSDPTKVKEFSKALREINESEVEFESFFAPIPSGLPLVYFEYFVPFVIEDFPQPIEEKIIEEVKAIAITE